MSLTKINGRDIGIAVQKTVGSVLTWVVIGCLTNSTFDVDTETDEATCTASGEWKEYVGGQSGFTLGGTLNVRQADDADVDTNITGENLLDMQIAGTEIQVRYLIGNGGGTARYTGAGRITKSSFKGQQKGIATYDFSVQGSGPLTKSLAPS